MPLLEDYIAQLDTVHTPADLNAQHADWLYEHRNEVPEAIAELNHEMGFVGAGLFRPHIMTTSVGDARGLLFVSANPGWSEVANGLENDFRCTSPENNREFCAGFFNIFRREVGANRWWSRALLLAHLVNVGPPEADAPIIAPRIRWKWAQDGGSEAAVANVDLIPFHSTGDQFGHLQGNNLNNAQIRLLEVARATLQMVLRFDPPPRLTFVGSALGAPLADGLCQELGMLEIATPQEDINDEIWSLIHRWVHPVSGAKVITFPFQVFAGFAAVFLPEGFMVPLAARMRAFADPVA